ncbi:hypothetical protein DIY18_10070 [Streptococcus iniae]|uniref:hypothetical protein n=1 Tax=Streptococcus iniae TaxID=1346 RepID=UPI000EF79987|nr:hypothetical protein [Streptococcus iniae]RLU41969.1 hypothetical protein DIY18_10070 [Streptococcus iniae]RMI47982.1 hypothetical protein DIY12_09895 [Streptococcus iniae]
MTSFGKIQIVPSYNCKHGDITSDKIDLFDTKIENEINRRMNDFADNLADEYSEYLNKKVVDELFKEKYRQQRNEFDYRNAAHDFVEGLDIEDN